MSSNDKPDHNTDWDSVATFIVEYQARTQADGEQQFKTLVTQMDTDAEDSMSEETWAGLQEDAPCAWMGGRLEGILMALRLLNQDPDEH
ncbi:MAG: hypothetical protein BWK73_08065 [Thiothrix lacustris]|uniref:Uncharacterized protein n=1 Tax=Thiothrix lacustris TaxID=525917 RepID=A0A1Y1QW26_9GAMM|nr:MAG: hypothetical protein BWK73_08065 [Thiothrix lacustris]